MSVAPTYRGHSSVLISGSTSKIFTLPDGTVENDLLFIIMESSDSTTAAGTPATPSGWEKVLESTAGAGATGVTTLTVFAGIAPASPGDVTVDGVGDHLCGRMAGVTAGTHGVTNVLTDLNIGSVANHGVNTTDLVTPELSGLRPNSLILWIMGLSDDANDSTNVGGQTNTNFANISERFDGTVNTGAGGGTSLTTATCAGTTTGSTGNWDHDTAENSQSVYIGIRPRAEVTLCHGFIG
jgi:hypothetical protein